MNFNVTSMFRILSKYCVLFVRSVRISLLDVELGLRLLQRGQTAVLLRAAGHGAVCFLSAAEFI